jgi:glycosyltransferase involved in cell wall biosynthesis
VKRPDDASVSILVPVYNELESLPAFLGRLDRVIGGWNRRIEAVFVDDFSRDGSADELERFCATRPYARILRHTRNRGRGNAVLTAVDGARGDILVTIDADLENPPESIPGLVDGMGPAVSCVTGYRKGRPRTDARGAASGLYNLTLAMLTGQVLHDCNCGLKAFRNVALRKPAIRAWLEKDGDYFRFIVVLLRRSGFRIRECPIAYAPRAHGSSRYKWRRYFKAGADLIRLLRPEIRRPAGRHPAARPRPEGLDSHSDRPTIDRAAC